MSPNLVFVGTGGILCAVDKTTGDEVWKFKFPGSGLASSRFVNVLVDGRHVYAHANGELHCIDAATGELLWTNHLSGMGYGLGTIAVQGLSSSSAAAASTQEGAASQHHDSSTA